MAAQALKIRFVNAFDDVIVYGFFLAAREEECHLSAHLVRESAPRRGLDCPRIMTMRRPHGCAKLLAHERGARREAPWAPVRIRDFEFLQNAIEVMR